MELLTIDNDYCSIDSKTLKRQPIHRAGFSFYKRGSLRSARQVPVTVFRSASFHSARFSTTEALL